MNQYKDLNPEIEYFVYSKRDTNWKLDDLMRIHSFLFILDGEARYEIEGKQYRVGKDNLIYIKPNTYRKATTERMNLVSIDFSLPDYCQLDLPVVLNICDITKYLPLFQELNNEWLKQGEAYQLKCKGLLLQILHLLFNEDGDRPKHRVVDDIKNYIIKNYASAISVNDIADVMGINSVYCGALFKKHEKCTINRYINHIRINHAASLIKTTNLNISEIAYLVGFNDIYYFSKTFKRLKGLSPSVFKNCSYMNDVFQSVDKAE